MNAAAADPLVRAARGMRAVGAALVAPAASQFLVGILIVAGIFETKWHGMESSADFTCAAIPGSLWFLCSGQIRGASRSFIIAAEIFNALLLVLLIFSLSFSSYLFIREWTRPNVTIETPALKVGLAYLYAVSLAGATAVTSVELHRARRICRTVHGARGFDVQPVRAPGTP